ncbi:methyltransferase domain-containing protein [Tolypothrix campylonemoides VB511288]|nr:methyltransferase domain-containing protein [Tolypothrix campylonemoides VB511288]
MVSEVSKYDMWHEQVHGSENPLNIKLEDWHKNSLTLSPPLQGLKILEVGCGVGDFAIYLSDKGADVTAVDFSPKAIELARTKAESQNKQVDFQLADAQALPFEDNSFDLIFSCECLEHVPTPQLALNQMYRVLKPKGKLILTTENYSNAILLAWIVDWLRKEPFNSGEKVQPIDHFFVFWQVRRMFTQAGFQVQKMIGSHHVFLLLPRFHPHTFVVERFQNPFICGLLRPFARHMAFEAIKQ